MFQNRFYKFAFVSVIVIAVDRVLKQLIKSSMDLNQSINVIGDLFKISYILNSGIAFGLLDNNPSPAKAPLLIIISLVALGVILYIFFSLPKDVRLAPISTGLIFGGAIGNIIDRIIRGKVIDFIDLDFPDIVIPSLNLRMARWPTFNIADMCVLVGIIMLLVIIITRGGEAESACSA